MDSPIGRFYLFVLRFVKRPQSFAGRAGRKIQERASLSRSQAQWALVTGASSGIGKAFAEQFAANGVNVVLAARSKSDLEDVSKLLRGQGVKTEVFAGDLSDMQTVKQLYKFIETKDLSVEYLVNNAGFGDYGLFVDGKWEKQQQMINLNITCLTYLTKVFAKDMKRRGSGRIVNVASIAAFYPGPLMAEYYATKAYVLRFSVAVANELKGSGVTVTALCPGPTASKFAATAAATRSGIFNSRKLPTSEVVASYGYKAMLKGKTVAIHGIGNNLTMVLTRLVPASLAAKIIRRVQS